jgi:hypothetical protein
MRTHLASLVAATTLVAAPLVAVATPAHAADCTAPQVLGTEVTPHNVVVGAKKVKGFDIYTDVVKNGCTISSVKVTVRSPKHSAKNLRMKAVSTKDGVTTYVYGIDLEAATLDNNEAGKWTATSATRWSGGTIISKDAFRVFRAAKLTANAKPEPVTAGKQLVVSGKLSRANWDKRKYAAYAKRKVQLQVRTSDGQYATVATVTSSRKGAVKRTVTAKVDGCYRFFFPGSSTTRTVTSVADCVDVR